MAKLEYTIPNDKVAQIADDWKYLIPNDERKLKDGINPEDVPENTHESDDTYYEDRWTDNAWVRESIKRWANSILRRSRRKQAQDNLSATADGEIT